MYMLYNPKTTIIHQYLTLLSRKIQRLLSQAFKQIQKLRLICILVLRYVMLLCLFVEPNAADKHQLLISHTNVKLSCLLKYKKQTATELRQLLFVKRN